MISDLTFQNHFLLAMPGMQDERFSRSVIYICGHTEEGAMGLVMNRPQTISFYDTVADLDLFEKEEIARLPQAARDLPIRSGGPVEPNRGFVLHSAEYYSDSSLLTADNVCLTATVDILRAIALGEGPQRAIMMLGYSGWGSGQLEEEMASNSWLSCPATPDLVFEGDVDGLYERVLASIGVDANRLSASSGHA